jgi:hypothetical protein
MACDRSQGFLSVTGDRVVKALFLLPTNKTPVAALEERRVRHISTFRKPAI